MRPVDSYGQRDDRARQAIAVDQQLRRGVDDDNGIAECQSEPPWVCWRLGLLDSNHGVVGLLGSLERCFELFRGDVCAVAV